METNVKRPRLKKDPGSYRHGDLANAVLDVAEGLVAKRHGPEFTLREIADLVGVSHPAVYRHFASRDLIVSALAARTFKNMLRRYVEMRERAAGDFEVWSTGLAMIYIDNMRSNPGAYRVMFAANPVPDSNRDEAAMACFKELVSCFELGKRSGVVRSDMPTQAIAASIWAGLHGMAMLMLDKRLPADEGATSQPRLVEAMLLIFKEGWKD